MNEISTLISSATAVVATMVALFLLRQGQVDRRKLAEDAEREHARQISAWADWHGLGDFGTFAKPRLPAVFVRNSSDAAVYDVFVDFRAPIDGALFRVGLGPVPPGETRVQEIDYDGQLEAGWEPAALFARVNFRDSSGRRWLRDAFGRLRADLGHGQDDFFEQGGKILGG
ncbi:hypothetical protein [Nocardioides donggukensis]|uniref:Uncharacterized protein n=1 Tax=Nocardioides donggukensis TaxID=2774019 RepID=A0A927Q3A5_9ACTN|nr:hypothetical protein [Nocardioides donggukensis]MBD8871154.1 hypothetical protein [Nocardioides donggukensis]